VVVSPSVIVRSYLRGASPGLQQGGSGRSPGHLCVSIAHGVNPTVMSVLVRAGSVPRASRASRLRRVLPSLPACPPTALWGTSVPWLTTQQQSRMETSLRCEEHSMAQHSMQGHSTPTGAAAEP
jgi:hypothetical protein